MAKRTRKPTPPPPSPNRAQGNKFDKIVKENMEQLLPVILNKIIQLEADCKIRNTPALKLQITLEKEPDFLKFIRRKGSRKEKTLHVEFEAKDERKTDARMAFYNTLIFLVLKREVEQHLIFLLPGKPRYFTGGLNHDNLTSSFIIHCISDYSYLEFIESEVPEEVLFSVLANPDGKTGEEIIRLILHRLVQLRGNSQELVKFVEQLKILSILRNLREETSNQVKEMSFIIPQEFIEADGLYIKGKEQGKEEGREEGIEEGMEKGKLIQIIIGTRSMLAKNFDLPTIADLLKVSEDFVLEIKAQLKKEPEIITKLQNGVKVSTISKALKVMDLVVEVIKKEHDLQLASTKIQNKK